MTLKTSSENDLISLGYIDGKLVVGFLHFDKGYLGVNFYDQNYHKISEKKIYCNKSDILRFTINNFGTYAATISKDGYFIKIFDIINEKLHIKFARTKLTKSIIHCLSFNATSSLLATSSSSGYIKIYNTNINEKGPINKIDW